MNQALLTALISVLIAASAARANDPVQAMKLAGDPFGLQVSLQYAFNPGSDGNLVPVISLGGGAGLGSTARDEHVVFVHYGVQAGATTPPRSRVDLARSLLLPDGVGFTLGAAHSWSNATGTRFVSPDVSIGARVVPWYSDTTALRVGISGGIGFAASRVLEGSIRLTRAVNALGDRNERRMLAASGSPDLWSSDVAATVGLHSRRANAEIFGTFGAYLFDSKFHVPPGGRSVFSLGVRKGFG